MSDLGHSGDVVARATGEGVVQHLAEAPVEARRAQAAVVGLGAGVLTRAAVVAGVALARAVGRVLALGPREGGRAQAARALVARHARATVTAVQRAAGVRVALARRAGEALVKQNGTGAAT